MNKKNPFGAFPVMLKIEKWVEYTTIIGVPLFLITSLFLFVLRHYEQISWDVSFFVSSLINLAVVTFAILIVVKLFKLLLSIKNGFNKK